MAWDEKWAAESVVSRASVWGEQKGEASAEV